MLFSESDGHPFSTNSLCDGAVRLMAPHRIAVALVHMVLRVLACTFGRGLAAAPFWQRDAPPFPVHGAVRLTAPNGIVSIVCFYDT